jgi:hypothetical protein
MYIFDYIKLLYVVYFPRYKLVFLLFCVFFLNLEIFSYVYGQEIFFKALFWIMISHTDSEQGIVSVYRSCGIASYVEYSAGDSAPGMFQHA